MMTMVDILCKKIFKGKNVFAILKKHEKMWTAISKMKPQDILNAKIKYFKKLKIKKKPKLYCYYCELFQELIVIEKTLNEELYTTKCNPNCPFMIGKKQSIGCTNVGTPYQKLKNGIKSQKVWTRLCLKIATMHKEQNEL